ncbi:uncharacterized protein LOC144096980 isoform X2 [Amblyomma americanum]
MEAKATFGRLMQLCKKHLEASAKLFPPKQFPTVVAIICHYYNSCRDSIPQQTPRQLLACGFGAAMDRTGLFYTHLNISDEARKKMVDGMGLDIFCRIHNTCVQSTKADTALEIFDCWNLALINKAYLHYVSEDVSPEQSQAIGDILACLRNTEGAALPAHVVDDLLAFWNQYVRTVG